MRCTVKNDAYQTVSAMTFVMPSGVLVDTSASDAEAAFERTEPDLAIGLLELRDSCSPIGSWSTECDESMRYGTPMATGSALCSTARHHSKSFVVFSSHPRGRARSHCRGPSVRADPYLLMMPSRTLAPPMSSSVHVACAGQPTIREVRETPQDPI
jgi:hypothetical protein